MGFCPLQYIGMVGNLFYYSGISCPAGTSGTAGDTRMHQLGVNCANIIDPIGQCGGAEHVCGCEAHGIKNYVTLREKFKPAKRAKVLGRCTAEYKDGTRRRKVRLFVVQAQPRGGPAVVLRAGVELAPATKLPAEGYFQATLTQKKGCYHCIHLDGMDGHCFHVITKGAGKAQGKSRARKRVRAAR